MASDTVPSGHVDESGTMNDEEQEQQPTKDAKSDRECVESIKIAKQDRDRAERCLEYPYSPCNKLTRSCGEGVIRENRILAIVEASCFFPKNQEREKADVLDNAYASLLEGGWGGIYDPEFCNPYSLNANPELHSLMIARFLAKYPEMIKKYQTEENEFLEKETEAFGEQGDAAFGTLQTDFEDVRKKCSQWDADPKHKLLPGACLLALDKKDTK